MDFYSAMNFGDIETPLEGSGKNSILDIIKNNYKLIAIVIIVLLLIWCLYKKYNQESEVSTEEEFGDDNSNLNDRFKDVVFVFMDGCGYCTKLKELLDENNVTSFKSLDNKSEEAKEHGFSGYPAWFSTKTGKKGTGYAPLKSILKELGH